MPLIRPTLNQLIARVRADIAILLPNANPSIPGGMLNTIIQSVALAHNATWEYVEQALREAFPQTATGSRLQNFSQFVTRNPASGASGEIVITGTELAVMPIGTRVKSSIGQIYDTLATAIIANQSVSISALSSASGIATAIASGHNLASGIDATISGAADDEYNGTFAITVIDENTFTYPIEGTPNSPTGGTKSASFTGAKVAVSSESQGSETNVEAGGKLTLLSPIVGIDNGAFVRHDALTGGADIESDDALRNRIIEFRSGIKANFSPETLIALAKTVPGVTRVKIRRAIPEAGDVTVHFVRDGATNIIPSAIDVANVRTVLLTVLPASSDESALIVSAPTPVSVDVAFSSITPNTDAMKAAIEATLQAFFEDEVELGVSITEDRLKAAILQTVSENDVLTDFTLSDPSADVSINADEIGILGEVTFA